jgi:glycosyltransferase involved in cell wall biosynthesis
LLVHGQRIRSELIEHGKYRGETVEAIPHGVLGGESIPFPMSDAEPATILFFGRIEAYKGLGDLLSACELLISRGVALHLLIAGKGSDLEVHRRRLSEYSWVELMEDFIPADAVPILFQRATIVALPYTDATQSGVAALAFAFGRPVVATNTGALPEVVIPGRTGLLVSPCSPSQLSEALADLLTDRRKLEALALGAANFAQAELNWPTIARRTTAAYKAAIQRRRSIHLSAVS